MSSFLLAKPSTSDYSSDERNSSQSSSSSDSHTLNPASLIQTFGKITCSPQLRQIMKQIESGFRKGLKPKLTDDGTSGTYLLRGSNKKALAVFKPIDEEAFAPHNPRDHVGAFGSQTFRAGVLSGEACIREVAASMLDRDGFCGVPQTTLLSFQDDSLRQWKFSQLKIRDEEKKDFLTQIT